MTHSNLAASPTSGVPDESFTAARLSFEVVAVILSLASLALLIGLAVNELSLLFS